MVPVIGPGRPSPPGPVVPVIWLGRPSSPLGPVVPVKGSVCWPPVRSPGQGRAPRSVAWGARRPPTTRLALTWVISLGGGIYRVGARRGATPPSTPVHEVDCGQGSSGPETYIYIYIRPVAAPLPATTQGSRSPATPSPAGTQTQPARSLAPSWSKAFGAPDGTPPSPFLPDSLPFAAPPICSSFAANWRMLGAYRDRRPEPLPPTPGGGNALVPGPRSPSEPTPTTRSIPLAHRASRQRAMPCWMDGRLGGPGPCSVARCQATVTLPLRCATTPTTERPA